MSEPVMYLHTKNKQTSPRPVCSQCKDPDKTTYPCRVPTPPEGYSCTQAGYLCQECFDRLVVEGKTFIEVCNLIRDVYKVNHVMKDKYPAPPNKKTLL